MQAQFFLVFTLLLIPALPSIASESFERQFLLNAQGGDLSDTELLFRSQPESSRSALELKIFSQYQQRFAFQAENLSPNSGNVIVDQIVVAYRNYWVEGLQTPKAIHEAETGLQSSLASILAAQTGAIEVGTQGDVYLQTALAVESEGFHVLNDHSPPLRDLIIWRSEERQHHDVTLTDGSEQVSVVFMEDFVSLGWSNFASLGLLSTSGWASDEELYCVRWAYDPESREFQVSYLQHEARHFADYRLYPGLDEEELEYRAKLTELAFVGGSAAGLLAAFAADADANGPGAHARANNRVTRDMYREMFGVEMPVGLKTWAVSGAYDVNPAARVLLERSSSQLESY